MFVYLITNTVNGKQYVGQTTSTVTRRWSEYKNHSVKGHQTSVIHKAIRKYSPESFVIETICEVDSKQSLALAESAFIHALNTKAPNGYNLKDGGDTASTKGLISPEGRQRLSCRMLGN